MLLYAYVLGRLFNSCFSVTREKVGIQPSAPGRDKLTVPKQRTRECLAMLRRRLEPTAWAAITAALDTQRCLRR